MWNHGSGWLRLMDKKISEKKVSQKQKIELFFMDHPWRDANYIGRKYNGLEMASERKTSHYLRKWKEKHHCWNQNISVRATRQREYLEKRLKVKGFFIFEKNICLWWKMFGIPERNKRWGQNSIYRACKEVQFAWLAQVYSCVCVHRCGWPSTLHSVVRKL